MKTVLCKSVHGRDLVVYGNFSPIAESGLPRKRDQPLTLLIGGTHGDERATVPILENFITKYLEAGKIKMPTVVISLLNPDGFEQNTRFNARGVDLNRNFPHNWSPDSEEPSGTSPLSEPESKGLYDFIMDVQPDKIVSLHWALAEIDADGTHSNPLAKAMWNALTVEEKLPYRLSMQLEENGDGVYCPGSLGQWCGNSLVYPDKRRPAMVTLELPHHPHFLSRPDALPEGHLAEVRNWWDMRPQEYLSGVEDPVHRQLEAACQFCYNDPYSSSKAFFS